MEGLDVAQVLRRDLAALLLFVCAECDWLRHVVDTLAPDRWERSKAAFACFAPRCTVEWHVAMSLPESEHQASECFGAAYTRNHDAALRLRFWRIATDEHAIMEGLDVAQVLRRDLAALLLFVCAECDWLRHVVDTLAPDRWERSKAAFACFAPRCTVEWHVAMSLPESEHQASECFGAAYTRNHDAALRLRFWRIATD